MAFGYETSSWWAGGGCVQRAPNRKKTSKGTAASRRRGDGDETLTPLPVASPRSSTTIELLSCNISTPALPRRFRTTCTTSRATDPIFNLSGTNSSEPGFFVFSRPPMKESQCLPTYRTSDVHVRPYVRKRGGAEPKMPRAKPHP